MDRLIEFATNHVLLVGGFVAVLLLLIWTELRRGTLSARGLLGNPVRHDDAER